LAGTMIAARGRFGSARARAGSLEEGGVTGTGSGCRSLLS
jgi:hypothetical protein